MNMVACVASIPVHFWGGEGPEICGDGRANEFWLPEKCEEHKKRALPIFRAAKARSLADLRGFLGFPFPENAQER